MANMNSEEHNDFITGKRLYEIKLTMEQVDLLELYYAVKNRDSITCKKLEGYIYCLLPLETRQALKND